MKTITKTCVAVFVLITVFISHGTFAASTDTLKVTNSNGIPGGSGYQYQVLLSNTTPIRGLLFNLKDLPESLEVTNVAISGEARMNNFIAYKTETPAGATKIIVIPHQTNSGKDIVAGSGPILDITVNVNATASGGSKTALQIDSLVASNSSKAPESMIVKHGSFWIGQRGDVSNAGDGVNLLDVLRMIDIVLNRQPPPSEYELWACDLDGDGDIDLDDIMDAIDQALLGTSPNSLAKTTLNELQQSAIGTAKIETTILPQNFVGQSRIAVTMKNSVPVYGVQLWIDYNSDKIKMGQPDKAPGRNMYFASKTTDKKLALLLCGLEGQYIPAGENTILELPIEILENITSKDDFKLVNSLAAGENASLVQTQFDQKDMLRVAAPNRFRLAQNSPNPFNMSTQIVYDIPKLEQGSVPVHLAIYNTSGQLVKVLENSERSTGQYTVHWDGRDSFGRYVSSGVYFYRLMAGDIVLTKKLAVMK